MRSILVLAMLALAGGVAPSLADEPIAAHPLVIARPDWIRKPDPAALLAAWPAKAQGRSGRVRMECEVTDRGILAKCKIVTEEPTGLGFGEAALMMAPDFAMRPKLVDGQPVGGASVTIPINFVGPGMSTGASLAVAKAVVWSTVPTLEQMGAAYPKYGAKLDSGRALVRCKIANLGLLADCETLSENPSGSGFGWAARSLTRYFTANLNSVPPAKSRDVYVDVPFDFANPARGPRNVEIIDPMWIRGVDPVKAQSLFPYAASAAGLKTGRAVTSCAVDRTGALKDCLVVSEDPPGLGFGQSVVAVASVMVMNPWTAQGSPVEGGRIHLPIRLNLAPTEAAAPTPKP